MHIFFVTGWFAGLFYLPRIFVNIAMVPAPGAERDRLLLMSAKLYRFSKILMVAALFFGLWLWQVYGIGTGEGWIHAKVSLVVLLVAFQFLCGRQLNSLRAGANARSHVWFRWFNEIPTLLLIAIVLLVVVKPF
jgi:putative membrane protein